MSAVEGELSSGVSGAGLYGPASELVLQMFWICLSQQTIKLFPLSDDLQDTWQMSLVSLYPPPDQPGSVKDTEEASTNTSSLWPEGFHEAVAHHSQQKLLSLVIQNLAGIFTLVQVGEVKYGYIILT